MPVFNLAVNVWHARVSVSGTYPVGSTWPAGKPVVPADAVLLGALTKYKTWWGRSSLYTFGYRDTQYFTLAEPRLLLLEKRVDVRPPKDVTVPPAALTGEFDVVQVPDNRQQWYYVTDVYDVGRGHANEFRCAVLIPWYEWWDVPVL